MYTCICGNIVLEASVRNYAKSRLHYSDSISIRISSWDDPLLFLTFHMRSVSFFLEMWLAVCFKD